MKPTLLFYLLCSAMIHASAGAEDWERIATETDEPGFAMQIVSVTPASQAESLGLEVGDYVYQIGPHAMRGFLEIDRVQVETLFYCRKNGRKGTLAVQAGPLGVRYKESLRPQIDFLRGEIGTRDPRWDAEVVGALATLETDPAVAAAQWSRVRALTYPEDDLDAFVRSYCAWRLSQTVPLRELSAKIETEYDTLPRLYATFLEDMAYRSGDTDLLRRLSLADPDSSLIPPSLIQAWETFDASPLPADTSLNVANASRGRDLREEVTVPEGERKDDRENQLRNLRAHATFAPGPGHYSSVLFHLPETVRDFHYAVTVEAIVPEHHEIFISEVRLSALADKSVIPRLGGRTLAELSVQAIEGAGTIIKSVGGYDTLTHRMSHPGTLLPVISEPHPGGATPTPAEFRIDLVRSGREIAAYCNGFAYLRLPIDPTVPTSELKFFVCGAQVKVKKFELWSLDTPVEGVPITGGASAIPELVLLQNRFEEAFAVEQKPIADLNRSFIEALGRLFETEKAKGNLVGALEVQKEMAGFADGSRFTLEDFERRLTDHVALTAMRSKYLSERERIWKLGRKGRADLLKQYDTALASAQEEQTKAGRIDVALALRNARKALAEDPRFLDAPTTSLRPGAFLANLHLVGKGEVEVHHNGKPLKVDNRAPDPDKYVDGTSVDLVVAPGDVIRVRMRATAVYRSFVLSFESRTAKKVIPVKRDDYRYLGANADAAAEGLKIESLLKIANHPEAGTADGDMLAMWTAKGLPRQAESGSEWIKCGPGADWHDYAIVIRPEMILPVQAE